MEKEKSLSEKSMEEVVGGVTIDGKDVSDSEFPKTVALSVVDPRVLPIQWNLQMLQRIKLKEKNLSEKSMEEVVGGVAIDGKDVSETKV